ncbi:hypothetical protein SAMN06295912_11145 [Sphingomonas laterariae]|uniref:Uncharacterized protein n=1 Tax=Edaphosphingomonas laterariae TaxID=861865 RepID=A0A239G5P4_9SPHN|nr:hypothetical protein [Sphingomonas laterariae]SNS64487.1 hypothetical protein SAMN06295912_11145 [Sphingomonas laterariae]
MRQTSLAIAILTTLSAIPAAAQQTPRIVENAPVARQMTYADLVALAEAADAVADIEVTAATKLKGPAAAGTPAGMQRFYIEGRLIALLGGKKGLPGQVAWLADVPLDAANRAPKLKKMRLLAFVDTVPDRPGELRLARPYGQMMWSADLETRTRGVLRDLIAADAPPHITRVGNAFHVPGSLPGESETQIFLGTDDGRPVSLNVLRRPGESPRWAVALGEMVDDSAAPPAPDSLLWYRLACTLPAELPDHSTADLTADQAGAARADYRVVIEALKPCTRNFPAG